MGKLRALKRRRSFQQTRELLKLFMKFYVRRDADTNHILNETSDQSMGEQDEKNDCSFWRITMRVK